MGQGRADLHQLAANAVAVVGARAATDYGTHWATELGRDLAAMGHPVVSGSLRRQSGRPPRRPPRGRPDHRRDAVRGRPAYPAAHAQLLEALVDRGLVVTEAPPGTALTRTRFRATNRIVAGPSDGTVVVERASRSGPLPTAR
ncbi:DNA-processing protein DprA [Nocardioides sp. IC4_145]|uniref:DNA-processing protein DprA n=1 Tax=Nocardioides sp. IC4_145 TaxID=2714037 RepID=UPI00325A8301